MKYQKLRWGILSTGNIAQQFVEDLLLLDDHEVLAVASRSESKARSFADQFNIEMAFPRYEDMLVEDSIDIIYIATPHNSHAEWGIKAMEAGKHVLCEKPITVNSRDLNLMIEASKRNNVFLMEALWTRFNPSIRKILELISEGIIGKVNYVNADFTFFIEEERHMRLMDPALAGGSLLEMGIYPVFLAYLLMGTPEQLGAFSRLDKNRCDWQTAATLQYQDGIAQVMSGFSSQSNMIAKISGTDGFINIYPYWHEAQGFTLTKDGQKKDYLFPTLDKGFTYEAKACAEALRNGWIEHPDWSLGNSLDLMKILDEIRSQTGIKYPFENT